MSNRDDFTSKTKETLCDRVGGKCSNPTCGRDTQGPHSESNKRISIGQAAHIKAAAPGGKRYDSNMSSEERKGIENGIWLCDTCARLIDSDEAIYTVELLRCWKALAEEKQQNRLVLLPKSSEFNRAKLACREIKMNVDDLQNVLIYSYEYWKHNFEDRYESYMLENELIEHDWLYRDDLNICDTYQNKKVELIEKKKEYALDIGSTLSKKIDEYVKLTDFIYQSDNWGGYNNYWRCFFETLSKNYDSIISLKNDIDELLYQMY